jgi:hypothetical protein
MGRKMNAAEHFLREFVENPQSRSCDPRHVKWALEEIEKLKTALEEASDLAITLCAECRKNIYNKKFNTWAHDHIGVGIIDIRNKAIPDE